MNFKNTAIAFVFVPILLLFVILSQPETLATESEYSDVVIPDFQVNDELPKYDYGSFVSSKVVMRNDGSFILVWDYNYSDIYARLFDSNGLPLGPALKVNDNEKPSRSVRPTADVDSEGNFVVVWKDYRWSDIPEKYNADIYAQRFDNNGQALGPNINVSNSGGNIDNEFPKIRMDHKGNFIIVWSANDYIYFQRYDANGVALDSITRVGKLAMPYDYDIAIDGEGGFVITWETQNYFVRAQRFDSEGDEIGSRFRVDDLQLGFGGSNPNVCIQRSGYFMIVWQSYNDYIGARVYDDNGEALGSAFTAGNRPSWGRRQSRPVVGTDNNGHFWVTLNVDDEHSYDDNIHTRVFDSTGTALSSYTKVNEVPIPNIDGSVQMNTEKSGNLVFFWKMRDPIPGVVAQRFNSDGTKIGSNFYLLTVNPYATTSAQRNPVISVDGEGNFSIAWEDERNGNPDVYAQRFEANGARVGSNLKVNDDAGGIHVQFGSKIAMNDKGSCVIVWRDYRNEKAEIYAQRFDTDGKAIGSNFKVNDDPGRSWKYKPDVDIDDNANFLVVWQDYRNEHSDVYAQRFDANGNSIGSNFRVNDDKGVAYQYAPRIAMDDIGNSVVVWQDKRNGHSDIFLQRYDANGTALGLNVKVNDDTTSNEQMHPVIDMDQDGNFVIAWIDCRDGWYEIYAQRFHADGLALGSNFRVTALPGYDFETTITLGVDRNGKFIIGWQEEHGIYGQLYDRNGQSIGCHFRIDMENGDSSPRMSSMVFEEGKLYSTWTDKKYPESGWDVFANVISLVTTNLPRSNTIETPANYALFQNYPNPFNSNTTITFQLSARRRVLLNIFNTQGQLIRTLLNARKAAGEYSVHWDGRDDKGNFVASGLYLCQLRIGKFKATKKMILLR